MSELISLSVPNHTYFSQCLSQGERNCCRLSRHRTEHNAGGSDRCAAAAADDGGRGRGVDGSAVERPHN